MQSQILCYLGYTTSRDYSLRFTHVQCVCLSEDRQPIKVSSLDTVLSLGYSRVKLHPWRVFGTYPPLVHGLSYLT